MGDYDDVEYDDLGDIADRVYAQAHEHAVENGLRHLRQAIDDQLGPDDVSAAVLLDLMDLGLTVDQADKAVIAAAVAYNLMSVMSAVAEASWAPELEDEQ